MQKSKFFTLFRTLNRQEVSAFGKYIKRLHSGENITLSVFDFVKKTFPDFREEKKLEIGHAFQKIFNEPLEANAHNRTKLLNALSDLHLWLKEFLLLEKVKKESVESQLFWMTILKERELNAELSRHTTKLQVDLAASPLISIPDYIKGMVSNYFYYYHLTQNKLLTDFSVLQNCGNNLDLFYAVCRLKIACEMANRKNQLSSAYNLEPLPAVIALSNSKELSNHPLLELYIDVYELIANGQGQRFSEIETLLADNVQKVEPDELHTILSYLHNFAASQVRHGNETYWDMIHRLNKFGVEQGIFSISQGMSSNQFNNIVNAACKAKDFKWVPAFIERYQHFLPEDDRTGAVLLAEAILLFEKKKYHEALRKLDHVAFMDFYHTIRSKALILRCYYEIADINVDIEGICLAFEGYLKRLRKPKQETVEATLNFIRIVKMLVRGKAAKAAVMNEIEVTTPLYFKTWLLEKVGDYKDYK